MQIIQKQHSPDTSRPETLIASLLSSAVERVETVLRAGEGIPKVFKSLMDIFTLKVDNLPRPIDLDCKAGCTACCHVRVSSSIPEVLVITEELKNSVPPAYYEELKESVGLIVKKGNTLDADWWLKTSTPCPFLLQKYGGMCRIYNIRPFTCRSYHSSDATQCIKGFRDKRRVDIPVYPHLRQAADLYSLAFIKAASNCGLASYEVGFIAALNIAMNDTNAMSKWLNSEDVFAGTAIK